MPHLFSFSYKNWTLIQNEEKNSKLRQKKFGGFCFQGPSKFLITSTRAGQTHLKKTNIQLKINKQTKQKQITLNGRENQRQIQLLFSSTLNHHIILEHYTFVYEKEKDVKGTTN